MTGKSSYLGDNCTTYFHRWEIINGRGLCYEYVSWLYFIIFIWPMENSYYSLSHSFACRDMCRFFVFFLCRLTVLQKCFSNIAIKSIGFLRMCIVAICCIASFSGCQNIMYIFFSRGTLRYFIFIEQSQFFLTHSQSLSDGLTNRSEISPCKSKIIFRFISGVNS